MNEFCKTDVIDFCENESFYKRYIDQNARQRLGMDILKFLYFKEGSFINPMKKAQILKTYIEEEKENFFKKNILNIPQVEFCITTKCTLKCIDCCGLIPQLDRIRHIEMSFCDFKNYLCRLLDAADSIRHFIILGGEPLVHKDLAKMIEFACAQEKINIVQLVSNGTMKFSDELLDVLKKNNKRIYVYISNYLANEQLRPLLKHEEIKDALRKNDIKFQFDENKKWLKEAGFSIQKSDDNQTISKIQECFKSHCSQVLSGFVSICPKAAAAKEMAEVEISDSVDIMGSNNLRDDLIKFYQNPCPDACRYCVLSDEGVIPALQK